MNQHQNGTDKYKIILHDNIEFYVETNVIKKSTTLDALFTDHLTKQYKPYIIIPNIDVQIFAHIISFIRHGAINEKDNEEFAKKLVESMDSNTLIDLIHSAELLDIKPLVKISGDRLKMIIENNSIDNIRKILKIKNDFSLEEEIQLEKSFKWY